MTDYAELHCHSYFSLLDGASSPEDLVARASELGLPALALTDHDGLYGAISFHQAAREKGIKPIIGAEVTLESGHHVTLLAENNRGYANLSRLITKSHLTHSKGKPAVDWSTVAEHADGLICLSGCRQGEVRQLLAAGKKETAEAAAMRCIEAFGRDNFYIELQSNLYRGDGDLCRDLVELADCLGVQYAATNNAHYTTQDSYRLHDILTCIKHRATLDKSGHLRRWNAEFYLKSADEMAYLFGHCPEALQNTLEISERCNVDLDFTSYRFPEFPLPGGDTDASYLARLCLQKAQERYGELSDEVSQQLTYELDLIDRLRLSGYFLIVWDIMDYARRSGIPAQGRGSAANSIVAYILGITRVDPIRHKLFVGRFINEEMSSLPDIDIDVSTNHREQLIQYVYQKYGAEHTAMVCTYITFKARNAIREVGKVLRMPPAILDHMAKTVGSHSAADIADDLSGLDKFRPYVTSASWEHFLSLSREIADLPRHLSIHVGGMIISSCPLSEMVPLERASMPGRVVCQWDKDGVADAGLVKVDVLGLRMLSLIDEAVELVRRNGNSDLDLDRIPLDDDAVYGMIGRADTLGVFQVESRAQMQTLPRTQPRSIEDLTVEVAIIRPGPLQGNMVNPYINRRQGREEVTYPHPTLKPILGETLGVILFQEQVLRCAIAIAGFSPGEADSLRRAMSRKRSKEAIEQLRQRFLQGARENDIDASVADRVFDTLKGFAEYGFCKSHAAGFALLAYQSAWLKHYHPAEFYSALLNNQPMGFYTPEVIIGDAKRHQVQIQSVDVNCSQDRCTLEEGKVRLGFRYVKEMGETAIARLMEARAEAPFSSLEDFYRRTRLSREAIESLILAGALDSFQGSRRQLLWDLGILEQRGRDPLMLEYAEYQAPLPGMTPLEELAAEYDVQGLSVRRHPMEVVRELLPKDGLLTSSQVLAQSSGTRIRTAGYVVCRQAPRTAKGHVFLTIEDELGLLNIILRPQVYRKYRYTARAESLLIVEGILQRKDGISNLIAEHLAPLKDEFQGRMAEDTSPAPRARNFC
jgi:error-prone DNA polymerase